MAKATCSHADCDDPVKGRGLCNRHYSAAVWQNERHGVTLPPSTPRARRYTDVDRGAKTLTCSIHGPGSPLQGGPTVRCSICQRGYGLTTSQREELLASQRGGCAICSRVDVELFTDHDHITMIVRGLLCQRCNTAVGKFLDDPGLLHRAIDYLAASSDPFSCTTGLRCRDSNDPDGTGSHVGVVEGELNGVRA